VQILAIGDRARAALAAAGQIEVVMTFSRGRVLQTDRGEILWCDSDPQAFSPRGVLIPHGPETARTAEFDRTAVDPFAEELDAMVRQASSDFVAAVCAGEALTTAAMMLVGLGRGLTPAGDDFLGGFLAVRHRRGFRDAIDTTATHAISRARLQMHMNGEGTLAEMTFVDSLLNGRDDLCEAEAVLRRLGHSSGEDFMRGACAAAELPR
jgi:hypothetical protein